MRSAEVSTVRFSTGVPFDDPDDPAQYNARTSSQKVSVLAA